MFLILSWFFSFFYMPVGMFEWRIEQWHFFFYHFGNYSWTALDICTYSHINIFDLDLPQAMPNELVKTKIKNEDLKMSHCEFCPICQRWKVIAVLSEVCYLVIWKTATCKENTITLTVSWNIIVLFCEVVSFPTNAALTRNSKKADVSVLPWSDNPALHCPEVTTVATFTQLTKAHSKHKTCGSNFFFF